MGQPHELQTSVEEKDLGVIIDPDLTFAKHVETKVNKHSGYFTTDTQETFDPQTHHDLTYLDQKYRHNFLINY